MTKKSKFKNTVKKSKDVVDIPIPNLPDNFLWMHVNSGTKIRNVLNYALKEFPGHKSVVWSGAGHGIGKVITCAELCKRKNPGLHQITKLRYVKSKNSEMGKEGDSSRRVPEIHILLAKYPLDTNELGYQSSEVEKNALFAKQNSLQDFSDQVSKKCEQQPSTSKLSSLATEEFAAMGLRTGQKRSHKGHHNTNENSSRTKSRKKDKTNKQ